MGPIRSLYEEGGELESLGAQQTSEGDPIILRPVQISDCGGYSSLPIHFIVTEFSGVTACPLRFYCCIISFLSGDSLFFRILVAPAADTAYGILMGSSPAFCDQAAAPVCDDVVFTQEATIGGGPPQCHEDYANMLTADAIQGEEDAQSDSQTSATSHQLSSEMLLQQQH